jgi:hypothetical protein
LEILLAKTHFLRPSNSREDQEADRSLIELRGLHYFHRYGNYIKILPNPIPICASQNKLNHWEHISGRHQWSQVAKTLAKEELLLTKAMKDRTKESMNIDIPAILAVKQACHQLKISENLVR